MQPSDFALPHPSWHPGQLETIVHVATSGAPFTLIEAPTGSGKTSIGLALAQLLDEPAYILTATKGLQDQYVEQLTSGPLATVRGRANFECLINPHDHAGNAVCTVGVPCEYNGLGDASLPGCRYWDQLRHALGQPTVVFNYAYYMQERRHVKRFPGPAVLICDEAHLVRDQILSFGSADLSINAFRNAKLQWPEGAESYAIADWVHWAAGYLDEFPHADEAPTTDAAAIRIARAHGALRRAAETIHWDGKNCVVVPMVEGRGVSLRQVWPKHLAHHLFGDAKRVILMTATPGDPKTFMEVLGIATPDYDIVTIPSFFDKRRRPVNYWPVGKISGIKPETWPPFADAVAKVLRYHANEKGIVHTVSYQFTEYLEKQLRSPRVLAPGPEERETTLAYFRHSSEPLVLLSPALTSGVDLPFDQCRFVILPKIPFPNRSDPVIQARALDPWGKRLAVEDAAVTLVQGAGRVMRDPEDFGTVWLLDENFRWHRHAAAKAYPAWFMESVVPASL